MTSVKVTNVSPKASEKDVFDFFSFAGAISSIHSEKVPDDVVSIAYVTFQDEKALETALLLSGAVIADRPVLVQPAPEYAPPESAEQSASKHAIGTTSPALKRAEDVVASLLAKGYILGKDAAHKAKDFDKQHELSKTASEKAAVAAEQVKKTGITERLSAGAAVVNQSIASVDEKYAVSKKTHEAFAFCETKINEAGSYAMKNRYVASGASWLSGAFGAVSNMATEISQKTKEKIQQEQEKQQQQTQATVPTTEGVAKYDNAAASSETGKAANVSHAEASTATSVAAPATTPEPAPSANTPSLPPVF